MTIIMIKIVGTIENQKKTTFQSLNTKNVKLFTIIPKE